MQVILFSCKDYLIWQGHGTKQHGQKVNTLLTPELENLL